MWADTEPSSPVKLNSWMTDLMETRIMAKMRYFPSSGTTSDVGGMISASSKKNTVSDSRMEMERLTWNEQERGFG